MGISFVSLSRRENPRSLALLERKGIAHLGELKIAQTSWGAARNCRESRDFGALNFGSHRPFLCDCRAHPMGFGFQPLQS